MFVQDFIIPLTKEDLLQYTSDGQFYVQEELTVNEIRERVEAARSALNEEGTDFIVDHFSTLFSIIQKFNQCSQLTREKGWKVIKKGFSLLVRNLQALFEDPSNLDLEIQSKMCNITKMLVYILIETMKSNQSAYFEQNYKCLDGKTKKKQSKVTDEEWDWNSEKLEVLCEVQIFLQLPCKLLWEPPVVDEEFVNMIANFCYTCLEDPGISSANSKTLRETIFQIFGILIRNYLHGLSFCVKVVQLLKINDHLVNVLAQGIVHLYEVCNCTNIVKEIVREVTDTDGDQLVADASGTRNLNLFLVQLAETIPNAITPAIDLLISHLNGDSYSMRICVVGVLGEIVLNVFTKENLDDNMRKKRDEYLDCLEEHIHDVNAFVRTKVLGVWQKLCIGKAIPILRLNRLLEVTIGRLNDKSTNVKKQAVHLIRDLLEGNPFCSQLNISEIQSQLEEERKKLATIEKANGCVNHDIEWKNIEKKLQVLLEDLNGEPDFDSEDPKGNLEEIIALVEKYLCSDELSKAVGVLVKLKKEFYKVFDINQETLSPEAIIEILHKIYADGKKTVLLNVPNEIREKIEKHSNAIEYLENALEFSELIDRALPVILTFLDSNVVTDVLEAIHFFSAAHLFGFKKALEGVRKMLYLIFSKEATIKSAVSNAYQDLYFKNVGSGRQQSISTVTNLEELVLKLNFSQLDALEEVVKQWVQAEIIDQSCVQVMFEKFSMKSPATDIHQSWASLVLIRMVGAQEPKIIKNNLNVLLSEGLRKHGSKNFLMAKETCKALQHLLPPKEQGKLFNHTLRYPKSHEIFKTLLQLLRVGIWKMDDAYYIPMAEEAINLVFAICDQPDDFSKQLIVQLHRSILSGKPPLKTKNATSGSVLNNKVSYDIFTEDYLDKENVECLPNNENDIEEANGDILKERNICLLTRFISILGQIACNYVLFLEGPVLDEFKLRNQLEYERKLKKLQENKKSNVTLKKGRRRINDSESDKSLNESGIEQLEFNRGTADDTDIDEMKYQTEKTIVTGDGFLAKFTPLILEICKNPGKYNNKSLQNAALLTLAKFMHVSSVFCEENLQLLVTICEKSHNSERQENAIIALGALQYRFPNSLEPWTPRMCAMLLNPNPSVRYSSILILTDLIVNEMIKARNHISNLAVCIVDEETRIARVARNFFREYSQKGNSLYNVLPGLISNLIQSNSPLSSENFKIVMKYILSLVTKEKQSEHLVEKLCQYFESATTERQWCDLAYCLSLLNYSDKGLRKILDNVKCFANKLYLAEVYEAFSSIVSEANKNPQKDKALTNELDAIVKECREKTGEGKNNSIFAPKKVVPPSTKKRVVRRKYLSSDSDEEYDWDQKLNQKKRKSGSEEVNADGNSETDTFVSDSKKGILRDKDLSDDSDESAKTERRKKTRSCAGRITRPNLREFKDSSDEEEKERKGKEVTSTKLLRSCKKKKV